MVPLPTTTTDTKARVADVLVSPKWLEQHLDDPAVRIVEVDVSPAAYDAGHIPGAVLWNVYRDLKDADYRLIEPAEIQVLLAHSGITAASTVVLYGYAPALAFWLMKLYRHPDVRILDLSRDRWRARDRPWTTEVPTPQTTSYPLPDQNRRIRADTAAVTAAIDDPATTLLDIRSEAEFCGERFWPSGALEPDGRAGHIPTAVRFAVEDLYDSDGRFRDAMQLADLFAAVGLDTDAGDVISYCTIGGRAATIWFALTYLVGSNRIRLYDGSWAEWGRATTTPVERP
jgi:thiosulfate/3-mercaptopyruvate sulfurtransferase